MFTMTENQTLSSRHPVIISSRFRTNGRNEFLIAFITDRSTNGKTLMCLQFASKKTFKIKDKNKKLRIVKNVLCVTASYTD
jgi:hypothetical protein